MHGVFGEFALLLLMSAAAGAVSLWLRQPVRYGDGIAGEFLESLPLKDTRRLVSTLPGMASNRDLLRGLPELRFAGEVAVVAREGFDCASLKKPGAPDILYPMRNAVDYAVETLTAIIRPKEDKS